MITRSWIFCLVLLWPVAVFAHTSGGEAIGFVSGFEHPISGLDHVLAMVAVGLWGAQLGPPALWLLPVTFPMVMAFGGMLGLMGVPVARGRSLHRALRPRAGFHGPARSKTESLGGGDPRRVLRNLSRPCARRELPPGENGILYSIGFVIATGLLHAVGIAIGTVHRWPKGRLALRAAGAAVMAGGGVFLWRALA